VNHISLNEGFMEHVQQMLIGIDGFVVRKMFGEAGLYVDGNIFGIVNEATMYLKTDQTNQDEFIKKGMDRFQPFKDRTMKMPYFEVPPEVLEDGEVLKEWSLRSLRITEKSKRS
jgi:DNA transformation protein and related proteins